MTTISEPIAEVTAELAPILADLEAQRRTIRQRMIMVLAIVIPVTIGLVMLLFPLVGEVGLFFPVLAVVGLAIFYHRLHGRYRDFFKTKVIARLVQAVDPTLRYDQHNQIAQSAFRASGLYTQGIDRYSGEDLFTGAVGATSFRFSEVHAEYKTTTTDSKGNRRTQWHTIFRGIFFIADFNKHFQGKTFVLPDQAERVLGGLGRVLQGWSSKLDSRPGEPVRLEDPEFEREFSVIATDQVEARYILSTSLMERLKNFRAQTGAPVAISFVNSQINIAISTSKNYFEPPALWRSNATLNHDDIAAYFADIRLAEAIVAELNLNTRIWSKQ